MAKKKYIGRCFEYLTGDGNIRVGIVRKIEFHQLLGKPIFIGESPYGNIMKLTREEICRFI